MIFLWFSLIFAMISLIFLGFPLIFIMIVIDFLVVFVDFLMIFIYVLRNFILFYNVHLFSYDFHWFSLAPTDHYTQAHQFSPHICSPLCPQGHSARGCKGPLIRHPHLYLPFLQLHQPHLAFHSHQHSPWSAESWRVPAKTSTRRSTGNTPQRLPNAAPRFARPAAWALPSL